MRVILLTTFLILLVGAGVYFGLRKASPTEEQKPLELKFETINQATSTNPANPPTGGRNGAHRVTLGTNYGRIVFETYDLDAPKTVKNFMDLIAKGFYDNLTFHRIIKGFMIQGGDPSGNGTGGPGYKFEDELNPQTASYKTGYKRGVVAMANSGPNTNGSQFFIMHQDYPLPNNYTIFGKVIEGIEVVDIISSVKTGQADRPLDPVIIEKATVQTVD